MSLLIVLGALVFLMLVAYRGYSVILFAPVAALGAVLLTDPSLVAPMFSSVFMDKMVGFVKSYFPVFMLGAVFGKVIELSGFSKSIVSAVIGVLGRERAILSIVVVCAILTYGGVSLFVVVFAVYPFAAEMFRQSSANPEHHPDDVLQDHHLGRSMARHHRRRVYSGRWPPLYRDAPPRGPSERRRLRHQACQRTRAVRGGETTEPLDRAVALGDRGRCQLYSDASDPARLRFDP
jgi:hypothetical protein